METSAGNMDHECEAAAICAAVAWHPFIVSARAFGASRPAVVGCDRFPSRVASPCAAITRHESPRVAIKFN